MSIKRIIVLIIIVGPFVVALAAYIGLIRDGSVPPPDWNAISRSIDLGTATAAKIAFILCLAVLAILAMATPVIYAIRANDALTILISLAMTGGAIGLLVVSRTVMDQISALIIFLANVTLSSAVYAAHRIAPRP